MSANRPVMLEALTDPDLPPMPPHITLEQARNFGASILADVARALGFLKQRSKRRLRDFSPRKG